MRQTLLPHCKPFRRKGIIPIGIIVMASAAWAPAAQASKVAWLDEVVQQVVREARWGGRAIARGGEATTATARASGRLFVHEAEEGLELAARRSEDLARAGGHTTRPAEALLQERFVRLIRHDPEATRIFKTLAPAEKRLVVEIGETAQRLARRYPEQAETMIRQLGTEGLAAVHAYGDDVAEVLAKEGAGGVGVLRKTGRGGWTFFTREVLPRKKTLAAAGVLAAFLANPEKFVDYAGRATDFAVREFARAGVQLAGAVGGGAARGLESAISETLANHGLNYPVFRYAGMALAALVVVGATLVLLGIPLAWMVRPFTWPVRMLLGRRQRMAAH
jgi:hypothetical protein